MNVGRNVERESGEQMSEPVAEARVHLEQNIHQFTNLKIIKAENDSQQAKPPRGRNSSELKLLKILEKEKPKNKIYSQVIFQMLFSSHKKFIFIHFHRFSKDYKTLKILPNELPQHPDIEKVKKEEYIFKKDEELITPVESSIETNEIDSVLPTDTMSATLLNSSEPFMEIISSIVDPTDSNEIDRNLNLGPIATTEGVPILIIERKDLEKTVTYPAPAELNILNGTGDQGDLRANEHVTVFSANDIEAGRDKENYHNLPNGGTIKGSEMEDQFKVHDPYGDEKIEWKLKSEDEDYPTESVKTPRPTEYLSKQRSMPTSTLLHGFLMNPGYPSFYIGKNSECKVKLKLNEGSSIALTILDLHLRSKKTKNFRWKSFI